ncbi:MAG: GNAT family N-acetyltransferase [Thermoplasmata archaeon]|nr:MAG: GNAT family N-acetyltransferase [Thermoplasmata archaeon]
MGRSVIVNVDLREAKPGDHDDLTHILVPAFSDKAEAILGDAGRALAIIPMILDALAGLKLLATENHRPVGAIIVSTQEIVLPPETFKILRKEIGYLGALSAARLVSNYEKSLPTRLDREARLEAVGVQEEVRNRGVGTQLIKSAEKWISDQGLEHFGLSVKTDNPAVRLYDRLGFLRTASFDNKMGHWYYMRKEVGGQS